MDNFMWVSVPGSNARYRIVYSYSVAYLSVGSMLYQHVMSVGAMPSIWNTAINVPVFQKSDPTDTQSLSYV